MKYLTLIAFVTNLAMTAHASSLEVAAKSDSMIWNGVAVVRDTVYVSGPRWTGSKGPSVARLNAKGLPESYPDSAWNSWQEGEDPHRKFVDINAIHPDNSGGLWVVDTGSPRFGGNPLPGGAKLVRIDTSTGKVSLVVTLDTAVVLPGSYVDDVRFHGKFAYLTDAGRPGIIVINLETGAMRRVLEDVASTTARSDRPIVVDGTTVKGPDHKNLRVNADPMEVSPDGAWFYFAPLEGPWSRISTRSLDDFSISEDQLVSKVEPWADLPPVGGTVMDANGDLYFSDLADCSIKRRAPDGKITTIVTDKRLHWVDAPTIDEQHRIWMPVPQMDRVAIFQGGSSAVQWPVYLLRINLPTESSSPATQ